MTSHDVHFEAKGNRWYFHAKLLDRQFPKNVSNRVDENQGDANDLIEGGKLKEEYSSEIIGAFDGRRIYAYYPCLSVVHVEQTVLGIPNKFQSLWATNWTDGFLGKSPASTRVNFRDLVTGNKAEAFRNKEGAVHVVGGSWPKPTGEVRSNYQLHICDTTGAIKKSKYMNPDGTECSIDLNWEKEDGVWIPRSGDYQSSKMQSTEKHRVTWQIHSFTADAKAVRIPFSLDRNQLPEGTEVREWFGNRGSRPVVVYIGGNRGRAINELNREKQLSKSAQANSFDTHLRGSPMRNR